MKLKNKMFRKVFKKKEHRRRNPQKIVCVGSSTKDIFFPIKGGYVTDTPEDVMAQRKIAFELGAKYQSTDRFESLGGCAANVAVGLSRLEVDSYCYTKTGDDVFGGWIRAELRAKGVRTNMVMIEKKCKSDLSAIIVDSSTGERVIFSNRDANERLEVHGELLKGADWVFVSSLNGEWEKNLKKLIDYCQKNSIKIAYNPGQKNIKDNPGLILEAMAKSETVFVNKDEAIGLLATKNLSFKKENLNDEVFLLQHLAKKSQGTVVLTDGHRGAWVFSEGKILHAPALLAPAKDSTGAGDAFTSAFLSGCAENLPVSKSLARGIVNSSNVVRYFGAIEGLMDKGGLLAKIESVHVEEIN